MVTVKAFGTEYDIPEEMIESFYEEFRELKTPSEKQQVMYLRDITGAVLVALEKSPERMTQDVYVGDFVKAHAMREALSRHGILLDS